MKMKRLNIAIKPDEQLADYAINLSKELSQKGEALFVLDGKNFFPHITLYSPFFPEKNINKISASIEKITEEWSRFETTFESFTSGRGFVGINIYKSKELKELYKRFVNTLNPLREGIVGEKYKDQKYLENLSIEEKENIPRYGYPRVFDEWQPHLSLIRFKNENVADKISKYLKLERKKLSVQKIGVYAMGENGTCVNLINEFKLRGGRGG